MQVHIIEGGKVVNTIEVESIEIAQQLFPAAVCRDASLGGQIGDLWDGQTLTPAPVIVEVPESVTALQGLLAIDFFGLSAAYEAWANAPERTFAERAFITKAQTWKRTDPTLIAAAAALGVTAQLDAMFIKAATL